MKPVVIVGAGPAGLAVAAMLSARRIPYVMVDASGEPGGAYRTVYTRMTLVSPSEMNALPGLRLTSRGRYTTAAEMRDYLARYASHHGLVIDRAEVGKVTRALDVTTDHGVIDARAVVVASGMWRFPIIPAELPASAIHASAYAGPTPERTLIIGGGASGVEIAEDIANAGATVWLSVRRSIRPVPAYALARRMLW